MAARIANSGATDTPAELYAMEGMPRNIPSDNDSAFIANELRAWHDRDGVVTLYIDPCSPWENDYAASFRSRLREQCLSMKVVGGLRDARAVKAWKVDYHLRKPQGSIGCKTWAGFAVAFAAEAALYALTKPTRVRFPTALRCGSR